MAQRDALALAAADEIGDGQVVGLGTGRAAGRAIRAIAQRVRDEGWSIRGVATSEASAGLAREVGIPLIPLDGADRVDVLLDGVDELDDAMRMIKGQGGAMTREMIVAHAAERRVYLMQAHKRVSRLGERCPVPVEVIASACGLVRSTLAAAGVAGAWRVRDDGARVLTDNGNPILDCPLTESWTPESLRSCVVLTPGVVGHGLVIDEADRVLIEDETGVLEAVDRPG
ncbi:MAG: ribose-5-phosphate isomerase RpiA [Planctomycetota bacterium]